jgi:hypothetical protein
MSADHFCTIPLSLSLTFRVSIKIQMMSTLEPIGFRECLRHFHPGKSLRFVTFFMCPEKNANSKLNGRQSVRFDGLEIGSIAHGKLI